MQSKATYRPLAGTQHRGQRAGTAGIVAVMLVLVLAGLVVAPAQAHAASAINKVLVSVSLDSGTKTKTTTKYDITGDKVADTIKIKAGNNKVRIYVNGTLCKTVTSDYGYNYLVKYVRTSTKHPFLYVEITDQTGEGKHALLQYKSGKMVTITTNNYIPSSYGWYRTISSVKASGKYIKVQYYFISYTTAATYFTSTFAWKSGTLKRTSSVATGLKFITDDGVVNGASTWLTLATSKTLYTSTSLSTAVTKVKSGSKVKVSKVCIKNKKVYYKLTTTSGKTGWVRGLTSFASTSSGTLLSELYTG